MRIRIKKGKWEDAIRIELHLSIAYEDESYFVDAKYADRVKELEGEGLLSVVRKEKA